MVKITYDRVTMNLLSPYTKRKINYALNKVRKYDSTLAEYIRWLIDDVVIEVIDRAKSVILMELHEKIFNEMKKSEKEPQIIKFLSKLEREIYDAMSLD